MPNKRAWEIDKDPYPKLELGRLQTEYYREFDDPRDPNGHNLYRVHAGFTEKLRKHCESSLYVLAKYVLGMRAKPGQDVGLSSRLHKPVCDWLQDMNERHEHRMTPELVVRGGRWKLLMLPVVHLKTSLGSHAFPIHALIQPQNKNIYFPNMSGADTRILLHGETVQKAKENLDVIKQHLESNNILRFLWPHLVWGDRKEAPLWKDDAITVRRTRQKVMAEPTVTAIGVGSGLEQRHYDIVIMDDLATFEAAQSELTMERARARRKACRSRLDNLNTSIELGIGTHWNATDIYTDWKKDPDVEVCIRSAIENGEAIWPEKHPLKKLLALQAEEGMGKVLFSANYMNNPLNSAFTALDWQEVRECFFDSEKKQITFEESEVDVELLRRNSLSVLENANLYALYGKPIRGMSFNQLYTGWRQIPQPDTQELHDQRMARMLRQIEIEEEGSATKARLEFFYQRRQREWEQQQAQKRS